MKNWEAEARNVLRAEMHRRGVNFIALQQRLEALGVHETAVNLSNKMGRGKFSFAFALQCMAAMQDSDGGPAQGTGDTGLAQTERVASEPARHRARAG